MPRYKLTIEYYGTPFVGWQRQNNGPSVQSALEKAAEALSGDKASAHAAGRTDTGVHALGMAIHLDFAKDFPADVVRDALNFHLKPEPIAVLSAEIVGSDFHARFSCIRRAYEYRIVNRRAPLTIEKHRAWRVSTPLNAAAMHEAAHEFVGRHDFTTFRATSCQSNSPVKSIEEISVSREGEAVVLRCAARSFLQHQVRSIVGTLAEVGKGRWSKRDVRAAINAKDRAACGQVAPPDGLYFLRADYEGDG